MSRNQCLVDYSFTSEDWKRGGGDPGAIVLHASCIPQRGALLSLLTIGSCHPKVG